MTTKRFCHGLVLHYAEGMTLALQAVVLILVFQRDARLPFAVETSAFNEAAAIWGPYGVEIRRADRCDLPGEGTTLTVAVADVQTTPDAPVRVAETLGAIRFKDGLPEATIEIFYANVVRLTKTMSLRDQPEPNWPALYRALIQGRILGRVIAHEIGHYLLRSRAHTSAGLMRPRPSLADLVDVDRRPFALSPTAEWRAVQ